MSENASNLTQQITEKAAVTLPGTVEKVIAPIDPRESEKAQIAVQGADELYREIRVENTLQDATGKNVSLKPGAHVDVTIKASRDEIVEKTSKSKE